MINLAFERGYSISKLFREYKKSAFLHLGLTKEILYELFWNE